MNVQNVEGVVLVVLVVTYGLWSLVRKLARTRPEFRIGAPLSLAMALRLAAIAGIAQTGLEPVLRGGDETTFLNLARLLASTPLGHGYLPHGRYQLHTVIFALEFKLGFLTVGAIRIVQVGIAMVGVVLILAAVNDLASGRAARLAAWLMAIEPTAIFYNSALHKEPNMELAAGLVVFGGTMIWKRLDVRGLPLCALGGLIAVETRSYAGWFLVSAAVLILLHAALRNLNRPLRAMPVIYAVAIVAFLVTPTLLQASSSKSLKLLQVSQNQNTSGTSPTPTRGPNGNNLALEQVNYSTRGAVFTNLPKRIRDVILKPYPWQLSDNSQRFGALGTLIAYAMVLLLIRYAWLNRGAIFGRAGPLLYAILFLLVAYSLSAGNAGTSFRYRSHLVTLGLAAMVILRDHARRVRAERSEPALAGADRAPAVGEPIPQRFSVPPAMPMIRDKTFNVGGAGANIGRSPGAMMWGRERSR